MTLIIAQPGMAERLLAEHADDGTEHCRSCSGGAQTGHYVYPCQIHQFATQAQNEVGRRRGQNRRRSA